MGKRHGVSETVHIHARDRRKCWICDKWKADEGKKFAYRSPYQPKGICISCGERLKSDTV